MKVDQSFTIARPADGVWKFFRNIPDVASCMPGATLTIEIAPGTYAGKISVRLGPFGASFEGEATVSFDEATRSGHAAGKGIDKRNGSRSKMDVDFDVAAIAADATVVHLDVDISLSGAIAQFGRTSIVQEAANILIAQFVQNLEARLVAPTPMPEAASHAAVPVDSAAHATRLAPSSDPAPSSDSPISAGSVIFRVLQAWLRRLFGGSRR